MWCYAGIKNAEFHCGQAEKVLPGLLPSLPNTGVVAVADPPRAGLRKYTYFCTIYIHYIIYFSHMLWKWILSVKSCCVVQTQMWLELCAGVTLSRDLFMLAATLLELNRTSLSKITCISYLLILLENCFIAGFTNYSCMCVISVWREPSLRSTKVHHLLYMKLFLSIFFRILNTVNLYFCYRDSFLLSCNINKLWLNAKSW